MNLTEMIKKNYSTDTYIKAMHEIMQSREDSIQFEIRLVKWLGVHTYKLKNLYLQGIIGDDEDSISMGWLTWIRFVFFIYEENKRITQTVDKEMNELLNGN